jgi:glycosyltransferase involved in cell wall biosynthesis
MERLSREHELRLVAFGEPSDDDRFESVVLPLPSPSAPAKGLRRLLSARRQPVPSFVRDRRVDEMTEAIAATAERFHPDVVQIETTEMAQYLGAIDPGPVRILDLPDLASRWFGRAAEESDRSTRAALMLEVNKTRKYERAMTQIADIVFVSSESDRNFLRGLAGVDSIEIPNGVDASAFAPMPDVPLEKNKILFIGSLVNPVNLEGLRWFVEEVFPLIRSQQEDVLIEHVGATVDQVWPQGVDARGSVPDVRPHLAAAALSIVPLKSGKGPRARLLEALAMGRPVVATPIAAEGLGLKDREQLLLAEEPDAFARAVVAVLSSDELAARLGKAGREYVVPRYDWNVLARRIAASWELAVSRKRASAESGEQA